MQREHARCPVCGQWDNCGDCNHFGTPYYQEGGDMGFDNAPTPGSYGHAVMTLAQGLEIAVREGWVTKQEAKAEFRSNVRTVRDKDALRKELARLETELDEEE